MLLLPQIDCGLSQDFAVSRTHSRATLGGAEAGASVYTRQFRSKVGSRGLQQRYDYSVVVLGNANKLSLFKFLFSACLFCATSHFLRDRHFRRG